MKSKFCLGIVGLLVVMMLTGAVNQRQLPLTETFEKVPGTDLAWNFLANLPLGDSDTTPPPGVVGWGDQCMGFVEGNDVGGYTLFSRVQQINMTFDVFVAPEFELLNSGWRIHLGDTDNSFNGIFLWGGHFNGGHGMSLESDSTVLAMTSVAVGVPHTIGISIDIVSGHWQWVIDGIMIAEGRRNWPPTASINGLVYAAWTWHPTLPYNPQLWIDNITLTTSDITYNLYMPIIGG